MAVQIYGLIDPLTNELRYVGKTVKSLKARLCGHIASAKLATHKRPVEAWICGLLRKSARPHVEVLETVDEGADWVEAEQFWIAYFRSLGARLTNLTPGGEGWPGRRMTEEEKSRRTWRSGSAHPRFGVKDTPQAVAEKSVRAVVRWADPIWAAKQRELMLAGVRSPENRMRMSISMRRLLADPMWKRALDAKRAEAARRPEVRAKTGAASKKSWNINREAIVIAQNAAKGDAYRAKQSETRTKLWQDPAYRSKTSSAHMHKIAPEDVGAIMARAASGETQSAIAASFEVNPSHISRIISGETLRHIPRAA